MSAGDVDEFHWIIVNGIFMGCEDFRLEIFHWAEQAMVSFAQI